MAISRRRFLQTAGATLVAVAGGTVYRSIDQGVFAVGQGEAYETWHTWQDAPTPQERIVKAGILAANPHNSQPWLFHIEHDTITMYADTTRQIGTIDPLLREMHIGLGCAVENMVLAAHAEGFRPDVSLMPDSENSTAVARLTFTASTAVTSDLYKAIPNRHTNRAAYDTTRSLPEGIFDTVVALNDEPDIRLFWFFNEQERQQFGDVTIRATEALIHDEQQSLDSHTWWRQGWSDIQRDQDGITLDAQGLDDVITVLAKIVPDVSREQSDQAFLDNMRTVHVPTAAAFGIIAVPDGQDNTQRLKAGRYWQRAHLWATTAGIAMHPLNQMCERADRERQLGIDPEFGNAISGLLNDPAWQGIMPFRMGYPTREARLSPRRTISKVIG